jgi:hypothetical protein
MCVQFFHHLRKRVMPFQILASQTPERTQRLHTDNMPESLSDRCSGENGDTADVATRVLCCPKCDSIQRAFSSIYSLAHAHNPHKTSLSETPSTPFTYMVWPYLVRVGVLCALGVAIKRHSGQTPTTKRQARRRHHKQVPFQD